jgi:hypothetical protein
MEIQTPDLRNFNRPTITRSGESAAWLVEIWLSYGPSEIPVRVAEERLVDILKPKEAIALPDPVDETERLLATNETFRDTASKASRKCIVLGYCGSRQVAIDLIRTVLKHTDNSQGVTTILCTPDAVELDPNAFGETRIVRHSNRSESIEVPGFKDDFTPQIDSEFVNADIRVLIGELRPHHFFAYSGLSDIVFPQLASETSIRNHLSDRPGLTLEGLHKERIDVAKSFDNLFALSLAFNAETRPNKIVFGGIEDCLSNLTIAVKELYSRQITKRADIVVMGSGGTPFDDLLGRAVEAFPAGLNALKKDGVLIVAAECGKCHGDDEFYEWSAEHKEARYLEARLRRRFNYHGFKAAFLARALEAHRIYLVSTIPDYYVENIFGLRSSATVNAALQTAQRAQGSDSTISVIPDACRIIPKQIQPA